MTTLTTDPLCQEAAIFSAAESTHPEHTLFGVTDGKAVGTYLELKFRTYLVDKGYIFAEGNTANDLDFPGLTIDMKVTSIKQPQSSCPFCSIRQKIYGLSYGNVLVTVMSVVGQRLVNPLDSQRAKGRGCGHA